MKHLDLFSGIGGFALAVEAVWPEAEHIFCEIDTYCQQVLKKHFPNSPIYGDIKNLSQDFGTIDLLTGGFPCQPFSSAGKQRAQADDRHLWPEMLRVIRETKPTWILGENVAGIINLALEQVCLDLEAEGYEVQPFVIPACAVNAPHRRDRVWIIAHRKGEQCERGEQEGGLSGQPEAEAGNRNSYAPDWDRNRLEVAAEFCGMDYGLPVELDGFKLTKAQHRFQRLKALGNGIVPQVAVEILKAIKRI